MTEKDGDDDYLKKLEQVDETVRQRIDDQFGQLRVLAIIAAIVLVLVFAGRWVLGV